MKRELKQRRADPDDQGVHWWLDRSRFDANVVRQTSGSPSLGDACHDVPQIPKNEGPIGCDLSGKKRADPVLPGSAAFDRLSLLPQELVRAIGSGSNPRFRTNTKFLLERRFHERGRSRWRRVLYRG
jgi:hypothetical protein